MLVRVSAVMLRWLLMTPDFVYLKNQPFRGRCGPENAAWRTHTKSFVVRKFGVGKCDIDADSTQPLYSLVCRQKICHATLRGMLFMEWGPKEEFVDGVVSGIHVERPSMYLKPGRTRSKRKSIASLDPWPFNFVFYAPACLTQSSANPPILSILYLHSVCRCRVHHLDSLSTVFLPCRWQNSIYFVVAVAELKIYPLLSTSGSLDVVLPNMFVLCCILTVISFVDIYTWVILL